MNRGDSDIVRPLRVLIAQTRTDVLAAALADAIKQQPDELLLLGAGVVDDARIEEVLGERPDVVFLIGQADRVERRSRELIDRRLSVIVVRHDIDTGLTHIDFRQLPLAELLQIIRGVAARGADNEQRVVHYRVHSSAEQPGKSELQLVAADPDGPPLLQCVTAWLDALIARYLDTRSSDARDVGGMYVSHATIRQTLEDGAKSAHDGKAEIAAQQLRDALARPASGEPLAALADELELSNREMGLLLLALAPELDPKYQRIFGYLNDDLSRRCPTLGLACAILGAAFELRGQLTAANKLAVWRLVHFGAEGCAAADELLRFDPTVANWIAGDGDALFADARVKRLLRRRPWLGADLLSSRADVDLGKRLANLLTRQRLEGEWLVLAGDDQAGWRALVETAAGLLERRLLRVNLAALRGASAAEIDDSLACLVRAARLHDALIAVDCDGSKPEDRADLAVLDQLVQLCRSRRRANILITRQPASFIDACGRSPCRILTRATPEAPTREKMFVEAGRIADLPLQPADVRRFASLFTFGVDSVEKSVRLARALCGSDPSAEQCLANLSKACRRIASAELPRFARRVQPTFRLGDVVLPEDRGVQLRDIVAQVINATLVLDSWGFRDQLPWGRGVAALFSGPSGTGKSMAAQGIANALDTDLFVVDISRIVSKYVGETEKNLDAVFDDAERAGAVLLFDEADGLFTRRSDQVRDAHDRYANLEVAFLLQRIEAYTGVAILTTNLRQNLDQAFMRRLRFIVEFPKPDAAAREKIWQQCLTSRAPCHADIDFRYLARHVDLTGGNIRQITLRAAFAAASDGGAIQMRHIIAATRAELRKLGLSEASMELAA